MIARVVIFGMVGAVVLGGVSGSQQGDLPGVALGSPVLLIAERAAGLFLIWMIGVVVVARALLGQLPSEISDRGMRYTESDDRAAGEELLLDEIRVELRWLRDAVLELRERDTGRGEHE